MLMQKWTRRWTSGNHSDWGGDFTGLFLQLRRLCCVHRETEIHHRWSNGNKGITWRCREECDEKRHRWWLLWVSSEKSTEDAETVRFSSPVETDSSWRSPEGTIVDYRGSPEFQSHIEIYIWDEIRKGKLQSYNREKDSSLKEAWGIVATLSSFLNLKMELFVSRWEINRWDCSRWMDFGEGTSCFT